MLLENHNLEHKGLWETGKHHQHFLLVAAPKILKGRQAWAFVLSFFESSICVRSSENMQECLPIHLLLCRHPGRGWVQGRRRAPGAQSWWGRA